MFEEFGPEYPPAVPAGALGRAIHRGHRIRRRRQATVSTVAICIALIGGLALADHLTSAVAHSLPKSCGDRPGRRSS